MEPAGANMISMGQAKWIGNTANTWKTMIDLYH